MMNVQDRFLKYITFYTTSDAESETCPSTERQKLLGQFLVEEMKTIGVQNPKMDKNGYIYGEIPSNTANTKAPKLAFVAHMDTSPDLTGENVKPQIIKNYDGGVIVLNKEKEITMSPEKFDHLAHYIGQDLIVTDGTTLLGADDKAGIAEIMSLAETLIEHPEIEHGAIKICFTPDEEIGRGADLVDLDYLDADFGYTVDGGEIGELEYENFNAASLVVNVNGTSIHPGSAKGQLKNALLIGMEFQNMLPTFERPEFTEHYEGFTHLVQMSGGSETAKLAYIIRDHDFDKFEGKKEMAQVIATFLNTKYGENTIELELKDSYYNMKEKIKPHFHLIETVSKAMEKCEVRPIIMPIRGGTDGSRLSYMGLPCPNICTGGHNFHGKYEYIPVQSMRKVVDILVEVVKSYGVK